jgi:site-specific recombinase XerD
MSRIVDIEQQRAANAAKKLRPQVKQFAVSLLRLEAKRLNIAAGPPKQEFAMLLFLYATAARGFEVVGVDLSDIDLRERVGSVLLRGKGRRERRIEFEGQAVTALRDWLVERDRIKPRDAAALWVNTRGERLPLRGLQYLVRRACQRAKIDGGGNVVHRWRATCATHMYDAGVDIERIRNFLGHASIETTRAYLAISEKSLKTRLAAGVVARVLGPDQSKVPMWARRRVVPFGNADAA